MYIEFSLPHGVAAQASHIITQALRTWSDRYNVPYNLKNIKYFKRITFDNEAHYAFFAMTWNPDKKYYVLSRWRIVSDLNNKTSFDSVL